MPSWTDEGFILATSRYGESSLKLDLFTREHGLAAGFVKGAASSKRKMQFDIGNMLQVSWRGRLSEQLGSFTTELTAQPASGCMYAPLSLAALNAMCALLRQCLPEHHAELALYEASQNVFTKLNTNELELLSAYLHFEVELLAATGFPLDLQNCADTGSTQELIYVSPKSGRAVCRTSGAPYHDKLFTLPAFLKDDETTKSIVEIQQAFAITSYFLEHLAEDILHKPLTAARAHLLEQCHRAAKPAFA